MKLSGFSRFTMTSFFLKMLFKESNNHPIHPIWSEGRGKAAAQLISIFCVCVEVLLLSDF